MPSNSVIKCCQTLAAKKLTISFAESASTGRLIYEFTSVPHCGSINTGSIVCYDRSVKENLLQIPSEVIDRHSAESEEVTKLMALSLQKLIPADISVAVTGLASEGGSETPEKPVGTMFIHAIIMGEHLAIRRKFDGNPDEIIKQCIDEIAEIVLEKISIPGETSLEASKTTSEK
mgnify:CR=1 FL=1